MMPALSFRIVPVAVGADSCVRGTVTARMRAGPPTAVVSCRRAADPYVRRVEFGGAGLITYLINDGAGVVIILDITWAG